MILAELEALATRFAGGQAIFIDPEGPKLHQGPIASIESEGGNFVLRWLWVGDKVTKDSWKRLKRTKPFCWRLEGVSIEPGEDVATAASVSLKLRGSPGKILTLIVAGHKDTIAETVFEGK